MKSIFILLAVILLALSQLDCGAKKTPTATSANAANAAPAGDTAIDASARSAAQKFFEQGNELARQDRDQEAADAYKQAITLNPDFAEAHLKLAMSYDVLQQRKDAEEEYKKATETYQKFVRENSKDAKAYFNMGLAYNKIGKPEEAVKAFRQAVRLDAESTDYEFELGLALGKAAQYQEAVYSLQKAIDLDPNNERAKDALDKAQIDLVRWQSMVKQQGAIAKKRSDKKNANANTSANIAPTSTPEVH